MKNGIHKTLALALLLSCSPVARAQYNVDRLLRSGRIALHYDDYVLSIQYFNQAIAQKPYLWEPWQLRAIAKFYLDDWHGAEQDASQALELNPYITELYDLRGISRIRLKDFKGAIADYSKALTITPNNRNFWYNKALCYMEDGDYDSAQQQLDTIVQRWDRYAPACLLKAETFMHQKDTVTAMTWLDRGLEIDPYNAEAWKVRGCVALQKEKWEEADEFLSKALHLKPKNVTCLINRALARLRLQNLRGAMEDYDNALEAEPTNFNAHYNRGLLRQQVGDDNRAIEDFNYVLELEPGNIMALFNRATLLDRTGDLKGAIRDYSRVIDKFPNFWTGLQYRAACYRRLGMTAKAEKDEFRVFKAQMDKHLGVQHRWSRQKLAAMRKLSDVDPEKYDNLVIDDEVATEQEYQSQYRGKVQNQRSSQHFMPYIAMTMGTTNNTGLSSFTPFDKDVDAFNIALHKEVPQASSMTPTLGGIGDVPTIQDMETVDSLSALLSHSTGKTAAYLLIVRSIAHSSILNYQEAIHDLNDALGIIPDSRIALRQRAVCKAMIGEYEQEETPMMADLRNAAIEDDFKRLLELDDKNAFNHYCYGTFLASIGKHELAITHLTEALAINPDFPQAYYNRGLVHLQQGKLQEARADLSKAGELGLYSAYSIMKGAKKSKGGS